MCKTEFSEVEVSPIGHHLENRIEFVLSLYFRNLGSDENFEESNFVGDFWPKINNKKVMNNKKNLPQRFRI